MEIKLFSQKGNSKCSQRCRPLDPGHGTGGSARGKRLASWGRDLFLEFVFRLWWKSAGTKPATTTQLGHFAGTWSLGALMLFNSGGQSRTTGWPTSVWQWLGLGRKGACAGSGRQVVSDGAEVLQAQPPLWPLILRSDRSVSPNTADQAGRGLALTQHPEDSHGHRRKCMSGGTGSQGVSPAGRGQRRFSRELSGHTDEKGGWNLWVKHRGRGWAEAVRKERRRDETWWELQIPGDRASGPREADTQSAQPGREWPQGSGQGEPVRGTPHPTTYQQLALRGPLLTNNLHPQGARGQWASGCAKNT